jgi:ketopantoate reductase
MIVVGAGRVGGALHAAAQAAGIECALVTRSHGWDHLDDAPGTPILVTVRNADLDGVVARVPDRRRADLVFVQNGMLRPWLRTAGLGSATRGLLFFAVAERGGPIVTGPDSPFCGPHALAVVRFLVAVGVPAIEVDWARFTAYEHEKLVWNTAFGLLCQAKSCAVGEVVDRHGEDLRALVGELNRVASVSMGFDVDVDTLLARLVAYTRTIPNYRGAVKEWPWRDGWFVRTAERYRFELPVHTRLCAEAGVSR